MHSDIEMCLTPTTVTAWIYITSRRDHASWIWSYSQQLELQGCRCNMPVPRDKTRFHHNTSSPFIPQVLRGSASVSRRGMFQSAARHPSTWRTFCLGGLPSKMAASRQETGCWRWERRVKLNREVCVCVQELMSYLAQSVLVITLQSEDPTGTKYLFDLKRN